MALMNVGISLGPTEGASEDVSSSSLRGRWRLTVIMGSHPQNTVACYINSDCSRYTNRYMGYSQGANFDGLRGYQAQRRVVVSAVEDSEILSLDKFIGRTERPVMRSCGCNGTICPTT